MTDTPLTSPPAEAAPEDEVRDVFLSYNSRDREAVQELRQLLQERGVSTFLDRSELIPGTSWFDALERGIGSVRAVAVFVGAEGFGTWQKREMQLALDRQANEERAGKVFPVIPVVLPGADTEKASGGFLLLNTWVDLRTGLGGAGLGALVQAVRGVPPPPPLKPAQLLCPYRALHAFREEDAPLFFGREVFAEELLRKVLNNSLVAVVGPSGSGKSSLVQAGLLPLLRRQRPPADVWDAVVITPGERPFHKLAAALVTILEADAPETRRLIASEELGGKMAAGAVSVAAAVERALRKSRGSDRLLLVVDQFEELFRQTREDEAARFISSLLRAAASEPVTIVLTLRADFYGQAIGFDRELSDRIQQAVVNLGPMTKDELKRSIIEPASQVGLEFERGLVNRILEHLQDQPGNLPLLEFALTELWERRQGHLLTSAAYEEMGCVAGALAKRAESHFDKLSPPQQKALLRVLTRLIRLAAAAEEGRDTRRRVKLRLLTDEERAALAKFVEARLVVTGRDEASGEETIELAHESLFHLWPLLRELLDRDREFLLWRQRLGQRLYDWEQQGRDHALLLGSPLLEEARRNVRERARDLNELELEYVRESEAAARRPRRWVARTAAGVAGLLLLYAGWEFYVRSDFYQVRAALYEGQSLAASERASPGEWARALILSGRVEEGLAHTRGLDSPSEKAAVLTPVSDALARIGRTDEARRMASEAFAAAALVEEAPAGPGPRRGEPPIKKVARLLVGRWQVEDLLGAARRIEKSDARARALTAAAESLTKAGKKQEVKRVVAEMLPAAREESDASLRSSTLAGASKLLADAGEAEEARRTADEALADARKVETPSERATAVGSVAEVLFKIGDAARGREATEEAFDLVQGSRDISFQSMTMMGFSEALIQAGRANEIMDVASGVENPMFRYMVLPQVLMVMVENGMTSEAVAATQKAKEPEARYMGYMTIAMVLAVDGKSDAAADVLRRVEDPEQRAFLTAQIAWMLALTGKHEPALVMARSVEKTSARPLALAAIAAAMAKNRKTDEALAALKSVEMPEFQLMSLVLLVEEVKKYERPEVMRRVIEEGLALAGRVSSGDMRCVMLSMLGGAQARLREYYEARRNIEPCALPDMKLDVYAAILLEYAKDSSPEAARVIKEFQDEQEKEEGGESET